MHASITHFRRDPDHLQPRYEAMLAEVPTENMQLHLCLRAPDDLVIIDTCPSEHAFREFHDGAAFRALRTRHGLPTQDSSEDFPVQVAYAGGAAVATAAG